MSRTSKQSSVVSSGRGTSARFARCALLGTTALVGVAIASPGLAQSFPAGGGTIVVSGGGTSTNNTGANGGFQNTGGVTVTVNDVTVNNTTGAPTADAIRITRSTFSGSGDGTTFTGTNTLTAASGGSGYVFTSTGGNNTNFTNNGTINANGLNGVVISTAQNIFYGGTGTFNLTAQTNGSGSGLLITANNLASRSAARRPRPRLSPVPSTPAISRPE